MTTYRFSANLGFLWRELPLAERISRAAACGFDAVEFHDDAQDADPMALEDALARAALPVVGLNVHMGDTSGCAAIPGLEEKAHRDVDLAAATAARVGAGAIHVLAGKTTAAGAHDTYRRNLEYALRATELTILIEPISVRAMPGYFLNDLQQAARIVDEIDHPRLKIMFDCFHIETQHGAVLDRFGQVAAKVGHVQIASVPDRAEPWPSDIDYAELLPHLREAGYAGAFGCEYHPASTVERGLGWRERFAAL